MTIKKLLEQHIAKKVKPKKVACLLSGGVDSLSLALAAHDIGKKVIAYSFHLKDNLSYDFETARSVAEKMHWKFVPVVVPTDNLVDDWHRLVKLGCRKKTHFECVFPFLYVYPVIKEKCVLTGWGSDAYFTPSKTASMRYSSITKAKNYIRYWKDFYKIKSFSSKSDRQFKIRLTYNQYRIKYLDGDCAGLKEHTRVAEQHGKIHVTPYLDKDVRKFLLSKNYKELNRPRQKEIIRKDFTKLEEFGKIKEHINLQLGAGVNKLFEKLLENTEINFKSRKRMMDVASDWYLENQKTSLEKFFK